MVTLTYLLLFLTLLASVLYFYTKKKAKKQIENIIVLGKLPILYGKHYHTFKKIDKLRLLFGAIALITLTIGIYAATVYHELTTLGLADAICFFSLFFAFLMELLQIKNMQKYKIQYAPELKISNKEKKIRLISIYLLCFCFFLLGILFFLIV